MAELNIFQLLANAQIAAGRFQTAREHFFGLGPILGCHVQFGQLLIEEQFARIGGDFFFEFRSAVTLAKFELSRRRSMERVVGCGVRPKFPVWALSCVVRTVMSTCNRDIAL